MKSFKESIEPKFQRATKTDTSYNGMINGKTFVVPHSFDDKGTTKAMRHSIVVSPMHVQHNNPTLTPEEAARVHSHIKDIHGGQPSEESKRASKEFAKRHKFSLRGLYESYTRKSQPQEKHKIAGEARTYDEKTQKWDVVNKEFYMSGRTRKHAINKALNFMQKLHPHHKEHEVKVLDEDRQLALHLGMTKSDKKEPPKEVPAVKKAEIQHNQSPKLVPGTPEHQAERDKYRHAALAASRKAATLAFAKKHHIIKERTIMTGSLKFNKIANTKSVTYNSFGKILKPAPPLDRSTMMKEETLEEGRPIRGDVFDHHQTLVAKKTLRMPDAMVDIMGGPDKKGAREWLMKKGWTKKQIHDHEHLQFVNEHVWDVTDHLGHKHEVEAKDHSEAMKKTVSVGGIHPAGIPMTQWRKVRIEKKNLEEDMQLDEALASSHGTADGHSHKVKSSYANGKFSGTIHTSHRDNRYSYTGPEARSPVEHEKPKHWQHAVKHGTAPSAIRRKNPHLDQTQAQAISRHFEEHKNKVRQLSESFMSTYHRNENANRHTANIVHLAKHFGDADDQAKAKFYADELKKHGHNIHHEKQYELHQKLFPKAWASHEQEKATAAGNHMPHAKKLNKLAEESQLVENSDEQLEKEFKKHTLHLDSGIIIYPTHPKYASLRKAALAKSPKKLKEEIQLDELSRGTLKSYIKKAGPEVDTHAYAVASANRKARTTKNTNARKYFKDTARLNRTTLVNRRKGIKQATARLKEEVEHSKTFDIVKDVLHEISQTLATKVFKARTVKMTDAMKKGDMKTAERHFNKSKDTATRMANKPDFDFDRAKKDLGEGVVSEDHLAPGTSVSFPHNGKMKKGKVVGFRPGTGHTSSTQYGPDSYVIYHGEAESAIVPHHKVVKEEVEHSKTFDIVKDVLHEMFTRKHFRQVADIIAKHPDATKRRELAAHHTDIFSKSNPRFDKKRFYSAANAGDVQE